MTSVSGSHKVDKTSCPHCKQVRNAAAQIGGKWSAGPKDGDITFCSGCLGWGFFSEVDGELTVRAPTSSEMVMLARNPEVQRIEAAAQKAMATTAAPSAGHA